ncbi:MAG: peptidoglycan-binding protein [Nitrosomonas sp.]|nr:peptidoglycan-binding protein [Nitrosomonas sp.]
MKKNFQKALKLVLVHEGGWSDHPKDPGGATMKGITLAVYCRHFGADKGKKDLRNISDSELESIYFSDYWNKCKCDQLPAGIDYAVFDAAVNSGPGRSAKWLQAAVGAGQDGAIGDKTLAKVKDQDAVQVTNDMCDRRLSFLRSLSTWADFGRGWQRRVEGVRAAAVAMAGGSPVMESTLPADYRVAKKGSTGLWVRKLQEALQIEVNGKFGPETEKALIDWQQKNGLEPDGIAGRNTYRALGLIA